MMNNLNQIHLKRANLNLISDLFYKAGFTSAKIQGISEPQ